MYDKKSCDSSNSSVSSTTTSNISFSFKFPKKLFFEESKIFFGGCLNTFFGGQCNFFIQFFLKVIPKKWEEPHLKKKILSLLGWLVYFFGSRLVWGCGRGKGIGERGGGVTNPYFPR